MYTLALNLTFDVKFDVIFFPVLSIIQVRYFQKFKISSNRLNSFEFLTAHRVLPGSTPARSGPGSVILFLLIRHGS